MNGRVCCGAAGYLRARKTMPKPSALTEEVGKLAHTRWLVCTQYYVCVLHIYAVLSTLRHPAHAVSVLILHPRDG